MPRLLFTTEAREDLADIAAEIDDRSGIVGVGDAFAEAVVQQCRTLADLPGILGSARPEFGDGLRSTPYKSYLIFFRYLPNSLQIVAIVHGNRKLARYFAQRAGRGSQPR